jgi:hypothetical protein
MSFLTFDVSGLREKIELRDPPIKVEIETHHGLFITVKKGINELRREWV